MAHKASAYQDVPATWPFRVAGTLLIVALSWFCLGFALEDVGEELHGHKPVFWLLLLIGVLFVIGGSIHNIAKERRRQHGA